jgi:hypothetical protein
MMFNDKDDDDDSGVYDDDVNDDNNDDNVDDIDYNNSINCCWLHYLYVYF